MKFLTIDGKSDIKTPATIQVDIQDVHGSETGRGQDGSMLIDRVAGGDNAKRKINCTWTGLSMSEISVLLQAMKKASFSIIEFGNLTRVKEVEIQLNLPEDLS